MKASSCIASVSGLCRLAAVWALLAVCLVACTSGRAAQAGGPEREGRQEALEAAAASPVGQADLLGAANQHHEEHNKHHGHSKYYQYAESPKKGAYKMGFKRGNAKHLIERKESVHKSHVESYFKWHDKKGKGSHKFEFKHDEAKKKHY